MLLVAILSALLTWWVWGAIAPLPLVQDESSYLLQSEIFASGHWAAPPPPIPEFFQQPHVLTTPVVASKYFPGHALLMTAGALVGAPVLVPLALTGIAAALLFVLVRSLTNEWAALLAWLVWLSDPIGVQYRTGYFSELTSGALWLVSWWTLREWRRTGARRWLLATAAAIGWGAITRPMTMLAFAIPVGIVVLRDTARSERSGRWRDLGLAVLLGTLVLAIVPLWSLETTGDPWLTPWALYTRDYMPFDTPGFHADSTPPRLPLLRPDSEVYATFFDEQVAHTVSRLPRIAVGQLAVIAHDEWSGPRIVLVPFVLLGLWAGGSEILFSLGCAAALFAAYLTFAHWVHWTLYSFEGLPVLAVLAGVGLWRAILRAGRWPPARLAAGASIALSLLAVNTAVAERRLRAAETLWDRSFQALLEHRPAAAAVIFVHYDPRHFTQPMVVTNSPHLEDEALWIVNDLGARDVELMRYAQRRLPFDFDVATGRLSPAPALLPSR